MSLPDPMEEHVAATLDQAGVRFQRNVKINDGKNELDFYIPELDLFIEVKQFSTPRTTAQIASLENVIVIQGKRAAAAFRRLIGVTD